MKKLLLLAALLLAVSTAAVACTESGSTNETTAGETTAADTTGAETTAEETTVPEETTVEETTTPEETTKAEETTVEETTVEETTAAVTEAPDDSHNYKSSENPDLSAAFTFQEGANGHLCNYGTAPYTFTEINQMTTYADGKFALSLEGFISNNSGYGVFFVRGVAQPDFGDPNYFGQDGHDQSGQISVGCAGIYASITDDGEKLTLTINVKGVDADGKPVPHIYKVTVDSTNITVADDGKVVTFFDGDKFYASIALSGDKGGLAEKAVVTLSDGSTETLESLAISSTVQSDIGFVARVANVSMNAVSLLPYSTVTVPEYVDPNFIPAWDVDDGKATITHQSFDELRKNNTTDGVFAPGASASWNFVANMTTADTLLQYWGWVGIKADTVGSFGYRIDNGEFKTDASWTVTAEQGVVDAAAGTGATAASRMLIGIDIAGMAAGSYTVDVIYETADGAKVLLNTFTLVIA